MAKVDLAYNGCLKFKKTIMNTNQKKIGKLKRPRKLLGREQGKIIALNECGCRNTSCDGRGLSAEPAGADDVLF
jgi:hypothetical protein